MNFGKFDMVILITMTVAIICMSFTFPALGLADETVEENEIPDFTIDADRFDFAGDFPDNPGTPETQHLIYDRSTPGHPDGEYSLDDTTAIDMVNTEPNDDLPVSVRLTDLEQVEIESVTLNELHTQERLELGDWEIWVEVIQVNNAGSEDVSFTVEFDVHDSPDDDEERDYGLLGGLAGGWVLDFMDDSEGALSGMVGVMVWIGAVLYWTLGTTFQVILNLMFSVADVSAFMVSLVGWLVTTYADIVSGANAWAGVFVAIPGMLLSLSLAKLVVVIIALLPTT